MQLIMHLIYRC